MANAKPAQATTAGRGLASAVRGIAAWPKFLHPKERTEKVAYLFMLPYLIFFLAFGLLPVLLGFVVSLTDWRIIGDWNWVGLRNYLNWLRDDHLLKVTYNTLYYTAIGVPAVTAGSLLMALYVNRKLAGYVFSRIVFFAPYVIAVTVTSLLWKWILETDFGVLNYYLMQLGLEPIPWLTNTRWAMIAMVITKLWWDAGFSMVIYLAGLQDIPTSLYEAGRIDGANDWQLFTNITLPLLRPVTSLVITFNLINCMQSFSTMFLMTEGGPAGSTTTLVYAIYQQSFVQFKMGNGAALSFMLFVAILLFSVVLFKLFPEQVDNE
jgi:multiple sugar transport system permease protein